MILNGLYLIWKNFWANRRMHFFTIVQIILVLLVFNIVLSIIQNTRLILSHYEGTDFGRAIYAAQIPTSQTREDRSALLTQLPQILDIDRADVGILAFAGIATAELSANLELYSDRLLEAFSLPLSNGSWLKPNNSGQGPIPIVISNDLSAVYNVGDIVSAKVSSWTGQVNNQVEVEVIGILQKNSMMIRGSHWATSMSLESIYKPAVNVVIMSLDRPELSKLSLLYQNGFFLFVHKDRDFVETYNEWSKNLTDLATIITLEEMAQNHIDQIRYPLKFYTSILAVLFFLALGGLGGNNALMLLGFRKECSVYFTCGCKWSWCVIMLIVQNLLVLFLPTSLAFAILTNVPEMFNKFMVFSTSNYLYSIIVVLFIFIVTSLDPLLSLAKESPISIIRRYD